MINIGANEITCIIIIIYTYTLHYIVLYLCILYIYVSVEFSGRGGVLSCFVIYICVHVEIPTSVYNLNALLVVAHEHVTNGK